MPTEPPLPPRRRARPGPAGRRQALGLPAPTSDEVPADAPSSSRVTAVLDPLQAWRSGGDEHEGPGPEVLGGRGRPIAPPPSRPTWRRLAFAAIVSVLVVAIPVLGVVGYRVLSDSTDGVFAEASTDPNDPGYEALVQPTPTAVVVQLDAEQRLVGATFLSLSSPDGGGAAIFVPLDVSVLVSNVGAGSLGAVYDALADEPDRAREALAAKVGDLLNVGVGEVIGLDDARWAQLVAPIAPIRFDNPEEVDLGDGTTIPPGLVSLDAGQVGPYLAVTKPGESAVARLARSQVVWKAWLDQLAKAGRRAVPGETTAGIGRFALGLAGGQVAYDTLPVNPVAGTDRVSVDKPKTADLVTEAVPSPAPARPGSRFTVRLLNGVSSGPIPSDLTHDLVRFGGSVSIIGNGPQPGQQETTIVYGAQAEADLAKVVLQSLGGQGRARFDAEAPDTVDLTIVLGKDILGDAPPPASSSPSASTTTTS